VGRPVGAPLAAPACGLLAALLALVALGLAPLLPSSTGESGVAAQEPGAGGSTGAIRVARRAITVMSAEPETRTLAIFERIELVNEADAPFVPSVTGGQGPMGLLRFGLPRNAFDLTLDPKLTAHEIIQVDRGFGSLLPLPPGATDVSLGYRVPYAGAEYELTASAVYPTTSLLLLAPADLAVSSPDLRLQHVADVGRLRYQVWTGEPLAAGQRVTVTIGGLPFTPRPWVLDETVQRATALALALLGVLGAWLYARARGGTVARAPSGGAPARVARVARVEDAP